MSGGVRRVAGAPVALEAVRRCVRGALRLEEGLESDFGWPAACDEGEFLAWVRRHRVVQLLAEQSAGLDLPASVVRTLTEEHQRTLLRTMLQVSELTRALDVLTAAGVDCLALKGPALSVQTTGRPFSRGVGDLDLLVDPVTVPAAVAALEAAGWTLDAGYPRPGDSWAWRRLVGAHYELPMHGERSAIDLHWALSPFRSGLPDFPELWADRAHVALGGRECATLSPRHSLAHSCTHAAVDEWRFLRSLVDVHRLARDPDARRADDATSPDPRTMAVTEATIGLPTGVPEGVLGGSARGPRVVDRARRRQGEPVPDVAAMTAWGSALFRVRRRATASRSAREGLRGVSYVVLPATAGHDIASRHGGPAIARMAWRRVVSMLRR